MTPTGVTHAIALDGAMTVCFNISLYILGEMRGIFCGVQSFLVEVPLWSNVWSGESRYVNRPWVDVFFDCVWFSLHRRAPGKLTGWWIWRNCLLLWLLHISFIGVPESLKLRFKEIASQLTDQICLCSHALLEVGRSTSFSRGRGLNAKLFVEGWNRFHSRS